MTSFTTATRILFIIALIFIDPIVFQFLWNSAVVPATGFNDVGFFQAWGITILIRYLKYAN